MQMTPGRISCKGERSEAVEFLTGTEDAGRPLGVVDAVGEVLGFQTERTAEAVVHAALALAVGEHIGGIKLYAGLIRIHYHRNACFVAYGSGNGVSAKDEIGIITVKKFHTGLVIFRIPTDGLRPAEIHGRTVNADDFPSRSAVLAVQGVAVGFDLQQMVINIAVSVQVEIAVVGEIDDRILIGFGIVVDGQAVASPTHGYLNVQIAGVALLAVGGQSGKNHRISLLSAGPEVLVEALLAAVEMVWTVVGKQGVGFAVQRKNTALDSISETTNGGTQIAIVSDVFFQGVVAQHNIHRIPRLVRHDD